MFQVKTKLAESGRPAVVGLGDALKGGLVGQSYIVPVKKKSGLDKI